MRATTALRMLLIGAATSIVAVAACSGDDTTSGTTTPTGVVGGNGGGTSTGAGGGPGGSGAGGGGPCCDEQVVECPTAVPAPGSGVCAVTNAGTSSYRLFRGTVLAPDTVFHNGGVLVDGSGIIQCVGCDCATAPGSADAAVVDCAQGVISPGLINTHDHITYAHNGVLVEPNSTLRYEHRADWRIGAHGFAEIDYTGSAPDAVMLGAELRFVMGGATSTASAGGVAHLLRNVDKANLLEGLPAPAAALDVFPLDDGSMYPIASGCSYGDDRTMQADIEDENAYVPHIGEGVDTEARNEMLCTRDGDQNLLLKQTAVIHAVPLLAEDAAVFRDRQAAVIWSPRTNVSLYGDTAPVTLLDALGVSVALGTDWLISGSMNMLRELRCADQLNMSYYGGYFSDFELWRMVTTNAARAVGVDRGLGMLKPGYVADIAIFDGSTTGDYRAVIASSEKDVVLVLRGGEVLYGDSALLDSSVIGGVSCEPIDVCGVPKKACVAQDTGGEYTLAEVRTASEASYPLLSGCATPPNEPTCVPYRDTYADGITSDDQDGDGVPNASDNCPTVFNPVRLLDEGSQADGDGDQLGDACDPCPTVSGTSCDFVHANDVDGDGWSNGADNCPEIANPDQADADDDRHGDACDDCPEANPGLSPCAVSITAVRNPSDPNHPSPGTVVTLTDLWVTALKPNTGSSRGFFVQDDSLDPFTGVHVFTGGASPTVVRGNRVNITGTYVEYYDLSEIELQAITIVDNGTSLPFEPIVVSDPADIATGGADAEGYESMLLEVGGVQVTVMNADAPNDYDEFVVTGSLRIDDLLYDALDNTYPVGTSFSSLVGIGTYSFSNYKLLPRDAADVQQ